MKYVYLRIHAARHSCAAGYEIWPRWIRRNTDGQALSHSPILPYILRLHIGFEAAIHLLGDLAEGQLAQSNQIPTTKEILERTLDFFGTIHIAALHAVLQGLWSEIDHHGFRGGQGHPIGHGLADDDSRDGAHDRRDTFDVLKVFPTPGA